MSSPTFRPNIKPLQGFHDFSYWADQMKLLFRVEDVYWFEFDENAELSADGDAKALLLIYTTVSEPILRCLMDAGCNDAPSAWEHLEELYGIKNNAKHECISKVVKSKRKEYDDEQDFLEMLEQNLEMLQGTVLTDQEVLARFEKIGQDMVWELLEDKLNQVLGIYNEKDSERAKSVHDMLLRTFWSER